MENKELLQLISILLQYPNEDLLTVNLLEDIEEIADSNVYLQLKHFLEYLSRTSLDELTEKYVQTFDFNDKTNLYLTYSKLKEERERGQILVKLKRIYEDEGLLLDTAELPDYLPLFLEFISLAKEETVKQLLPQFKEPIKGLHQELVDIESPYAGLMEASLLLIDEVLHQ